MVAAELQKKTKKVVYLVFLGFLGTSATRFWQQYTRNHEVRFGMAGIILSYLPAIVYYQYHSRNYDTFVGEISNRYRTVI